MKTVYKYAVPYPNDDFILNLPEGAEILTVQVQFGRPQMWALVDTGENVPLVPRHFRFAGTGHSLELHGTYLYIDTIQMHEGTLVWHIFEHVDAIMQ